jgi:hypothetical protein
MLAPPSHRAISKHVPPLTRNNTLSTFGDLNLGTDFLKKTFFFDGVHSRVHKTTLFFLMLLPSRSYAHLFFECQRVSKSDPKFIKKNMQKKNISITKCLLTIHVFSIILQWVY